MTKAPHPGRVKTRLTPPLSPDEAAGLNMCFLRDTAAAIARSSDGKRALGVGVYTPVGAEAAYEGILPLSFVLIAQRGETFGERLAAATEDLLSVGFNSLCLIDSDSPTVPETIFSEAVAVLSRDADTVVIGPSDDGGYYLIGMKKVHPRLFEKIEWSSERVLEHTVAAAAELNVPVHLLPPWYDVDDRVTLHRLCCELFGANGNERRGFAAPATRQFLSDLLEGESRVRIWPNESSS
jgi:rSAM/selenodomain-associated transferase 1